MTIELERLRIAEHALDLARNRLRNGKATAIHAKGDRDLVSDIDFTVEREIRAFLSSQTPDIGFLGEEEGFQGEEQASADETFWTLDPVDGTSNFVRGIPLCGTSLALIIGGKTCIGAVDLPFLEARYTAIANQGSFCNGHPLRCAATTAVQDAVVSLGDYAVGDQAEQKNAVRIAITSRLAANVHRVRMFGSAAADLVWLAEGHTDACVILSNKPWDTAAGVIIAREAGAHVRDMDGTEHGLRSRATIGMAPGLTDDLLALLQTAALAR